MFVVVSVPACYYHAVCVQVLVEKGPVDYITSCAKYTLSEDKLYTDQDKEPAVIVRGTHSCFRIVTLQSHFKVALSLLTYQQICWNDMSMTKTQEFM